ncbi:MAG: exosome complex exonuclease Rrp41 [Candidatus Aenigmarchaeota archaeon]|nr:exosome complex exonuclease Rrp41 [Candidatus Aenigmarchaeota archaeon]
MKEKEKLIINRKRLDGRDLYEMRKIEIQINPIKNSMGSAMFKFGKTWAIAATHGPRAAYPKWQQNPEFSILKTRYMMLPFSTWERSKPGISRRSIEISKVVNDALSNVIFLEDYPKTMIDVFIDIIEADASTRCAALNAASIALALAGVPLKDIVSSCSVGKIDGEIVLDIAGFEDNYGEVDCAVAMIPHEEKVLLLQMDGIVTKEEFKKMIMLAKEGCLKVYESQKTAIKQAFTNIIDIE